MSDGNPSEMTVDELRARYLTESEPPATPVRGPQTIVTNGNPMSSVGGLPEPTEEDQQAAARGARETAGRTPRQTIESRREYNWMSTPPPPLGNPKDMDEQQLRQRYLGGAVDNGVDNLERLRLNRVKAYSETVPGAARLSLLAKVAREPDPPDLTPEMKAVRKEQKEEYLKIVDDLQAAEHMPGFGTTLEAMAALGGQLEGTLIDPTSWIGWGAKGATLLRQAVSSGVQQAGIQVATDPLVQALNINAGVRDEYDPVQTALSGAMGFGIGFGGHLGAHALGEGLTKIFNQAEARKTLWDLSNMDPAFDAPRMGLWALDPVNGIPAPHIEPPRIPTLAEEAAPPVTPSRSTVPEWAASGRERALYEADAEIPKPPGTVRVYHGGAGDPATFDELHVTPFLQDGAGWAADGKKLWYADVPADSPWLTHIDENAPEAGVSRSVAPKDVLDSFKLLEKEAPPPPPDHGFEDTVADHKERLGEEAPPEQAAHEAFHEEAGARLETALQDNGIPPEKLTEIQKHYDRRPGESVDDAAYRAIDDWIDEQTRAQQALESEDPVLRQQIEQAEAPAVRDKPPEDWIPPPDVMAEARRLAKGWAARQEGQRPPSLISFVRKSGGLRNDQPEVSDLLSQDIGRQPGLVRSKAAGGIGFDEMAERVRDWGWDLGPDLDIGNGVNAERFLEMLIEDASGRKKHYPRGHDTEHYFDTQRYNEETNNHLRNRLGINPKGMDPRQIAWILSGGEHERTGGRLSAEGGGVPGGRGAQPGEGQGTLRLGDEPAVRGERDGERAAGGEAGAAAAGERGEGVGGTDERGGSADAPVGEARGDQAQGAQDGGAPVAKLEGVGPVTDTRGAGSQYHGTGDADLKLDSSHYSSLNYYGQGFYTTDAVDVGGGYARSKRNRKGEPSLYRVEEVRPLKILDGEQPFPEDVRKVLEPVADHNGSPISDLMRDVSGTGFRPKNMRELYDELRDIGTSDGYTADSIQEVFDSINRALRELGYDGLSHQGGLRTKKAPHRVVIYFDPEKDIRLVKENWPGQAAKETPKPATPEPPPLEEAPRFPGDPFNDAPSMADLAVEPPKLAAAEINRLAALMPAAEKEEFNLLWAMGANEGHSAARDTARFVELADKHREPTLATEHTATTEPDVGVKALFDPSLTAKGEINEVGQGAFFIDVDGRVYNASNEGHDDFLIRTGKDARQLAQVTTFIDPRTGAHEIGVHVANKLSAAQEAVVRRAQAEINKLERQGVSANLKISRDGADLQAERIELPTLATERTSQGEQTLMPGVEPVSDKTRAETQMAKSLRGGDAPPPAGGLFDEGARAQTDIFDKVSGRETPDDPQAIAQRKKGGLMSDEPVRAPVEQTELPSPEQDLAIRSLQQQSTDLGEALDFPLRQGRLHSRKNAGEFNPRTGVVRVREVPDFDVVSHEAGHALESKVGVQLTTLTQQHSVELRPMDYDPKAKRVNEGFAEYVRLYLTNPEAARRHAPTFDLEFRAFMRAEHPDLMAKMDAAAEAFRKYNEATSINAVGAVVRSVQEDPGAVDRMAAALTKDELPNTIKSWASKVYETMWDDKAPMTRFVREMGKAISFEKGHPLDLKAADNPDILFRLAERSGQAATLNLQYGVRGYHQTYAEGPSIVDALATALGEQSIWGKYNEGRRKDFSAYLVARRADYLWDRHNAGLLDNPPVAFSQADAKQAMSDLDKLYPNFKKASGMVHDYTREMLKKAYEGHILPGGKDTFDKLMEHKFYVPFMRDMKDKPVIGSGMGKGAEGPGTTAIVSKIRGSSRDIIDPIESIMGQTFLIERTLAHNDVVLSMARLSKEAKTAGGKWVEQVPAHEVKRYTADLEQAIMNRAKDIGMDADEARTLIASLGGLDGDAIKGNYFAMERAAAHGEPIVFYREGGELKAVRIISKEEGAPLYELLTAAPPVVTDMWANLVTLAAGVKRSSIITNPTFMISNYIRDQMAASLLRSDYVPFVGGARGMVDEWRQANSAILYAYAGGVAGGRAVGVVDQAIERDINALGRKGYSVTRLPNIHELKEFASFTEAGTRNSIFATVYEASMKKGLSSYEAMVEAAFQAQDLLDFSRHGSRTMWLRKFLPFFNAHLQGLDKARRTMIDPLFRGEVFEKDSAEFNNAIMTWVKAGGVGAALGTVYAAVMSETEAYRDASPYLKGTHLVVPFGNKLAVVPKPFEMGLGFTMGEYAWHMLAEKDPRAMRMLREAAWSILAPPDPIADMPIVTPVIELGLGKSWFTKRDIVPQSLQAMPAGQQFTDRTSTIGKTIGQSAVAKFATSTWLLKQLGDETGISPIKIDYAIGAFFATWGRDVMALSQGVDENAPAASLDDALFFRRFVKDPTRSSDATVKFWEYMARTTGKFNQDVAGYNDLVREATIRGQPLTAASEYLAKMPAAERAFVTLKSAANDAGKPAFTAAERRLHPLQHAYDAVELLNGLRKELATNMQTAFAGRGNITLNPVQRRDLLENVRELGQMEMRNAMVITEEGGYAGRPMLKPEDTMAKIRAISPAVADEIATRYATAKIYSTEAVRRSWPQVRNELVRNGSNADIRGLAFDAVAEGYQFNGTKARRPGVIRQRIDPAP